MQLESKMKRNLWVNVALGLVPDAGIALVLARATESGAVGFLIALLGLQALYFMIWLKDSMWSWAIYWFAGRRQMTSFLRDYLRENEYPEPETHQKSAEGYLAAVAEDAGQPIEVRLRAAAEVGSLRAQGGQPQASLRLSMAYEDAIEEHKRYCKTAGSSDSL